MSLVEPVVKYAFDRNIRVFKRNGAISILLVQVKILQKAKGGSTLETFNTILLEVSNALKEALEETTPFKAAYFSELIELLHASLVAIKTSSPDSEVAIQLL